MPTKEQQTGETNLSHRQTTLQAFERMSLEPQIELELELGFGRAKNDDEDDTKWQATAAKRGGVRGGIQPNNKWLMNGLTAGDARRLAMLLPTRMISISINLAGPPSLSIWHCGRPTGLGSRAGLEGRVSLRLSLSLWILSIFSPERSPPLPLSGRWLSREAN